MVLFIYIMFIKKNYYYYDILISILMSQVNLSQFHVN